MIKKTYFTLLTLCLIVSLSYGQEKFIILDSLEAKYPIHQYTLKTDSFYNVKNTIELYNIMIENAGVVLISVLPPSLSEYSWNKVDMEKIPNNQIIKQDMYSEYFKKFIFWYGGKPQRFDIQLIKREKGEYYVTEVCMTEYFVLVHHSSDFNTPRYVINTGQSLLSIRGMEKVFKENFPNHKYVMTSWFSEDIANTMVPFGDYQYIRMYLSRVFENQGNKAYQFWTYAAWNVSDGWNHHRGIDRLIYIPNKGIVGGSYDFYFNFYSNKRYQRGRTTRQLSNITKDQWISNILDEKVMLAEELK